MKTAFLVIFLAAALAPNAAYGAPGQHDPLSIAGTLASKPPVKLGNVTVKR